MKNWKSSFEALRSQELSAGLEDAKALLDEAEEHALEERCTLAFLGEWSRGKTSLINALLGEALLPTDIRPTTAALVTLTKGSSQVAQVHYENGRKENRAINPELLRLMQSEETGGLAEDKVLRIDLQRELGALGDLRIVDTPGVNDLRDTPEELIYRFLPFVDLGVFVLDATNGGLSASEEDFLKSRVLGRYAPNLLFVVNHMDGVDFEDEEERADFKEEIRGALKALLGEEPQLLFGTGIPGLASTEQTIEELREALLASAEKSVARRRGRILHNLVEDLRSLFEEKLEFLAMENEELRARQQQLSQCRESLDEAFEIFRAHVIGVGRAPLLQLIHASLDEFRRTGIKHLERQIALNTQLAAYAEHGLPADFETLVRSWVERHLPEIQTFLSRHARFVNLEYQGSFGGQSSIAPGNLRLKMPVQSENPLIDSARIAAREKQTSNQRFIVPGVLSVLGGMIALPLGVVGLYGGMKIAADMKTAEDEAIRSELKSTATTLIDEKIRSMKDDFGATIHAYFDDLDAQLERVFTSRLDQAARELENARAIRDSTRNTHQEIQARIEEAKRGLLEFQGAKA